MAVFVRGAVPAKQSKAKVYRTIITEIIAVFTESAFCTPALRNIITVPAIGAMCAFFLCAVHTHVAPLLGGTAVADIRTRATGALSALVTHFYALITSKTLAAIGRSVYPLLAFGTVVARMNSWCVCRNQSDYHHKRQ